MRSVFAFALLAVGLSYAQTDSLPACDATMRAYRAQFEALMYSGMTPVAGTSRNSDTDDSGVGVQSFVSHGGAR
jgi:hypothetical protein